MKRVLIIGGYGNFGRFISCSLAREEGLQLIIAGRSVEKAKSLVAELEAVNPAEACYLDIDDDLSEAIAAISPDLVIHTSGPFQGQGYQVAEACISCRANYIDLADGREFVSGITVLNERAREAGVFVISGCSSVPCLTSAIVDHYKSGFSTLESLDYGITTAQKTTRGVATTAAILGYTGQPFTTRVDGRTDTIYGWQSLKRRNYNGLGNRFLGNCNIPDLDIFPERYPELKELRFYAGLEIPFIHLTLWGLSWLVRARLIRNLDSLAPVLLKLSFMFDWLGTANSGFHMKMSGTDKNGGVKTTLFELIARNGDGPFIPSKPAIILAKRLARSGLNLSGANPCVGIISLEEYLAELSVLDISWQIT